jgi:hypothetical protein
MPVVDLDANEWQHVMAMISSAPWRDANPLLMKIGQQLQQQHTQMMSKNVEQPKDVLPTREGNGGDHAQ